MTDESAPTLEQAYRDQWVRLLAMLTGEFRSLDVAEEALGEAFAAAATTWPTRGAPDNPGAWLLTTARRRAIDLLRRDATATRRLPLLVVGARSAQPVEDTPFDDDRLRLIFTCCHPALSPESRVALTLRYVAGTSTAEIAHLFLVSEPTMAARLTRAKKKIAVAGVPYRVPGPDDLPERLQSVLGVVYLVFTTGYSARTGPDLLHVAVADEAIRLARLLLLLMPKEADVSALLSLMLLQHARRDARLDPDGDLVRLPDQDRSRWHGDEIREAVWLLRSLARKGTPTSRYVLEARIAAEHAVAVAEVDGPELAMKLIEDLDEALSRHHMLPATRAELLRRVGRHDEAIAHYDRAIEMADTDAERRFLELRRRQLTPD